MVGDAGLEILGNTMGFLDDGGGVIGRQDFVCSFGEERQPALEMGSVEGELEVLHHRVAFIAACGEENGGPEVLEKGEVIGPVIDDGVEDGADVRIEANLGIEAIYQEADFRFRNFGMHGHSLSRVVHVRFCRARGSCVARHPGHGTGNIPIHAR
jgi:hypothetical protein